MIQTFKLTDYTVVITQNKVLPYSTKITQTECVFINITNINNYKIYEKTISISDLCNYPYIKTLDDLYNFFYF